VTTDRATARALSAGQRHRRPGVFRSCGAAHLAKGFGDRAEVEDVGYDASKVKVPNGAAGTRLCRMH